MSKFLNAFKGAISLRCCLPVNVLDKSKKRMVTINVISRWSLLILGLAALFTPVALAGSTSHSGGGPGITDPVGEFDGGAILPTGKIITPTAAPGSTYMVLATELRSDDNADANGAVATALSPDGETLLVLTSGYNKNLRDETTGEPISFPVLDPVTGLPSEMMVNKAEWVFIFDVSTGNLFKKQQINIPNTFNGIAWAPDGLRFYVSGGIDDRIYVYSYNGTEFFPEAPFILLGHNSNQTAPVPDYDGGLLKGTPADIIATGAVVAGLDVSKDGKTLVAANFENDSISVVDTETRQVVKEIKFFEPGGTVATGEFPFDVAIVSDKKTGAANKVFVSSQRDDEVLAVDLETDVVTRIPVGVLPTKMLLSPDQTLLYVANSESDTISVINTQKERVVQTLSLTRRETPYTGSIPNSLAIGPEKIRFYKTQHGDDKGDDKKFRHQHAIVPEKNKLYVTLANENAVAVIDLHNGRVEGRIPTGWYPSSVSVSQDGRTLYVVNTKDVAGPNPSGGRSTEDGIDRNTTFKNEYVMALQKAGISTIPVPAPRDLAALSKQVDRNNGFKQPGRGRSHQMMKFLQRHIKHVVYIIKENRTYDQVLGDLPIGNGDPELTLFPEPISPNHHKFAMEFVTFDNFYASGSVSGDGWGWSTFARTTDYTEKTVSVIYGNAGFQGLTYDFEGNNRFILPAVPETSPNPTPITARLTSLLDPTGSSAILPGDRDLSAPAGTSDIDPQAKGGYLWDSALRASKSVRAYGILMDQTDVYYATSGNPLEPDPNNPLYIPISPTPFEDGIPQAPASKTSLQGRTDIYFRGYDQKMTDIFSFNEWKRDLEAYIAQNGTLPNLITMALDHDHFGSFSNAVAGVNTPSLQMADNDYALGLLVEYLSNRPEWKQTAIFVIEDDAQNGPDHVDAFRTLAYIISPYTRRGGELISTNYNTVNMIRTMEDVLGIEYLGINDANALPMSDAFTKSPDLTPYTAILPGNLCEDPVDTDLLGITAACNDASIPKTVAVKSRHNASWWANAFKGFDFEELDNLDSEAFNLVLWAGIKGEHVSYPANRSGADLRKNRKQLIAQWRQSASHIVVDGIDD